MWKLHVCFTARWCVPHGQVTHLLYLSVPYALLPAENMHTVNKDRIGWPHGDCVLWTPKCNQCSLIGLKSCGTHFRRETPAHQGFLLTGVSLESHIHSGIHSLRTEGDNFRWDHISSHLVEEEGETSKARVLATRCSTLLLPHCFKCSGCLQAIPRANGTIIRHRAASGGSVGPGFGGMWGPVTGPWVPCLPHTLCFQSLTLEVCKCYFLYLLDPLLFLLPGCQTGSLVNNSKIEDSKLAASALSRSLEMYIFGVHSDPWPKPLQGMDQNPAS